MSFHFDVSRILETSNFPEQTTRQISGTTTNSVPVFATLWTEIGSALWAWIGRWLPAVFGGQQNIDKFRSLVDIAAE
jgi:hypothetical protein